MTEYHYLLIIDPAPIDEELKEYFAQFNLAVVHQTTLHPLQISVDLPAAILIHWSLLKDQLEIIGQLYEQYPAPLLIISDHHDEERCIMMLEAGADDFLVKPLYPRELHARITAINRRVLRVSQKSTLNKEVLTFTHWRLYPASRQVFDEHNNELLLSVGEYELLSIFAHHPQKILNREYLLQNTKNSTLNPFDRRIDVQISRLRQKIEVDAKKPALIKTIRNNGYMFMAQVTVDKEHDRTEPLY